MDFMVEIKNEYGKLPEIELTDFEKVNNVNLPADYRNFLLSFNGGKPVLNINGSPSTVVVSLLGMHNGPYYTNLYWHIEMFNSRLPFDTFPIAKDPFGNLFIMTLYPETHGYIYFWDHEGEPETQDGHYVDNCCFVACSFTEFINNLN